jgi:hypothetical protein
MPELPRKKTSPVLRGLAESQLNLKSILSSSRKPTPRPIVDHHQLCLVTKLNQKIPSRHPQAVRFLRLTNAKKIQIPFAL